MARALDEKNGKEQKNKILDSSSKQEVQLAIFCYELNRRYSPDVV